jgi:hypothetical protein
MLPLVQVGTLDKESVLREQAKEAFCAKRSKDLSQQEFYLDINGFFYRRESYGNPQLIVQTLIREVTKENDRENL